MAQGIKIPILFDIEHTMPEPRGPSAIVTKCQALLKADPTTDLKATLSSKEMNSLQCVFRHKLNGEQSEAYSALKDKAKRLEWIAQFVMDPKQGISTGYSKVSRTSVHKQTVRKRWLTQAEISDLLKSEEMAKRLCASGDLASKPHDFPSLAKEGVLQYHYTTYLENDDHLTTEETGTKLVADLKSDEYTEVTDAMKYGGGASAKPKRKASPGGPGNSEVSPELAELKKAKIAKNTALRKVKTLCDKITSMTREDGALLPIVVTRGYPQAMSDFLAMKINELDNHCSGVHDLYVNAMTEYEASPTIEKLQASCTAFEGYTKELDIKIGDYKKNAQCDLKRMSGTDSKP